MKDRSSPGPAGRSAASSSSCSPATTSIARRPRRRSTSPTAMRCASSSLRTRPDVIVHCAAWTAVDACESDPDRAFRVNAIGVRNVAEAARARRRVRRRALDRLRVRRHEADAVRRVGRDRTRSRCTAARSSRASSRSVPAHAVVRTSWVCGRYGANMVKTILRLAGEHETLPFVDDQRGHPTSPPTSRAMLVPFAVERPPGSFHVTNQGAVVWFEFAQAVLAADGDDPSRVGPDHDRRPPTAPPGAPARELGARQPRAARRRHRAAPRLPRVPRRARRPDPRRRARETDARARDAARRQTMEDRRRPSSSRRTRTTDRPSTGSRCASRPTSSRSTSTCAGTSMAVPWSSSGSRRRQHRDDRPARRADEARRVRARRRGRRA